MATHKVPQDVEAEDKLIGILSLKQFIFVLLGLGFGYLTFFFFMKVHPVTAIIWIPPTLVCLILGLYQRKDQPVEVYLASALRFHLKPHKRLWDQEGYEERVIITAPPKIEKHYTKGFSSDEATSRLSTLGGLMDSRGWTSKMVTDWQNPQLAAAAAGDRLMQPSDMSSYQATPGYTQPVDMMDETTSRVAQNFQNRIQQTATATHQRAVQAVQQASQPQQPTVTPRTPPVYHKYPQMHQKVVAPQAQVTTQSTQDDTKAQQLAELSRADDLNVQALAAEAKHITGEVEVNLH